jgi:hypothetical protein
MFWKKQKRNQPSDDASYDPLFPDIPVGVGVELILFSYLPTKDLVRCRLVSRKSIHLEISSTSETIFN